MWCNMCIFYLEHKKYCNKKYCNQIFQNMRHWGSRDTFVYIPKLNERKPKTDGPWKTGIYLRSNTAGLFLSTCGGYIDASLSSKLLILNRTQ